MSISFATHSQSSSSLRQPRQFSQHPCDVGTAWRPMRIRRAAHQTMGTDPTFCTREPFPTLANLVLVYNRISC